MATQVLPQEAEVEQSVIRVKEPRDVVRELVKLVGVLPAAMIGGVNSEKAVKAWMRGDRNVPEHARLRFALRLARLIVTVYGDRAAEAWFLNANSMLDDRAPAMLLRDDFSESTQKQLLASVRALLA